MSSGILGSLLLLLILVPAWIGSLALRKARPHSGAKVLFIGCVVTTFGVVAVVLLGLMVQWVGPMGVPLNVAILISSVAIPLGILVFMIGFALHGLQSGRVVDRITELETIVSAQQEQISRLEGQG